MKNCIKSNETLTARLAGYAAAAGTLVALAPSVESQVIYSGLQNLELNLPETYMEIDLDGDMVNDFGFQMQRYSYMISYPSFYLDIEVGYGVIMNLKTDSYNNSWITKGTGITINTYYGSLYVVEMTAVDGLEPGEAIDSIRSNWANYSYIAWPGILGINYSGIYSGSYYGFRSVKWNAGEFLGEEKYIGVRFYIGDAQHYGWIRVSMDSDVDPMTIVDWAYNSTPGDSILAGDGLGIDLPPWLRISGGGGATVEQTRTLTISATEEITGFEMDDLVITNGSASNFTEITAGWEYAVDITATAEGTVMVEIPAGAVMDLLSNENSASSTSWIYDLTRPIATFFPYFSDPTNSIWSGLELDFNEKVTGMEPSDFVITNGYIDYFDDYGNNRYYYIEVVAGNEGVVTVELPAGSVNDLAGNQNLSASYSWTYDGTVPEVTLDAGITTTSEASVDVDVTFSEPVTDLFLEDFLVTNGEAGILHTITDNLHYTVQVTAIDPGVVILTLPEYSVWDAAYNGNPYASIGWLYEPIELVNSIEEGISIYPNPASDFLRVELSDEALIQLVDVGGNILYEKEHASDASIDVSGFIPGIYIIRIQDKEKVSQHKIIIE